jgi:hypothetical protein
MGIDVQEAQGRHAAGLALEGERRHAHRLDDMCDELVRSLSQEDLPGLRGLLEASGRVDGVARDECLPAPGIPRHDLSGLHAGACDECRSEPLLEFRVQLAQPVAHLERRPHCAQGVVLMDDRHAEHRHDGVADELLDRPSVPFDGRLHGGEVPGHHLPERLRIELLGENGGVLDIGEDHRHDPARVRCIPDQSGTTGVAESRLVLVPGTARCTRLRRHLADLEGRVSPRGSVRGSCD